MTKFSSKMVPYADADTAPYRLYVVADFSGREIGRFWSQIDREAKACAFRWLCQEFDAGRLAKMPERRQVWLACLADETDPGMSPTDFRSSGLPDCNYRNEV